MNRFIALAVIALSLAACGRQEERAAKIATTGSRMPAADAMAAPPPPAPAGGPQEQAIKPKLAYSHRLALEMAADKIAPRYERARAMCLGDAKMGCILVQASIAGGDARARQLPYASLTVRLPHDKIALFEQALLAPLEGEAKGEPIVRERSTDAEDLTYALLDVERRLAQLTDYRDRLVALAKRGDAKVDDLIKIEEKISEVQSQIEALQAQQRGLNQRVDTEVLSISLAPIAGIENVRSPLAEAWRQAGQVLGESAARAFTFLVMAIAWIPVALILLVVLRLLWRVVRGRWRRATSAGD